MRIARETSSVWNKLFARFEAGGGTRQAQLRAMVVHGILSGMVPPGMPVPASRALAEQLGVSRNTVALALQSLLERGFLVSRARSGLYVNPDILKSQASVTAPASEAAADLRWSQRFRSLPSGQRNRSGSRKLDSGTSDGSALRGDHIADDERSRRHEKTSS